MKPIAWWIVAAVFLAAPAARAEEDHSGIWILEAEELIVDLQQDAQGALTGTVSRKGARFAIRGKVAPTSRRCRAWVTTLGRNAVALVASGPGMQLGFRTGDRGEIWIRE